MSATPTRANPSPRYRRLLAEYQQLHEHGEPFLALPPEQTFAGQSLLPHAVRIAELIDQNHARSLLDYGAGKGDQYRTSVQTDGGRRWESLLEFWNIESLTCYDPGYEPFREVPSGRFDGVLCTDVLEHCPVEDVPWIVDELFGYAKKFVYANVACYPARKRLPSGENAHCTIMPPDWWRELLSATAERHPTVRYEFVLHHPGPHAREDGSEQTILRGSTTAVPALSK